MSRKTSLKIFVASGSELKEERKETIHVVQELRKVFPSLNLEAVEWETEIPSGSYDKKRIQDEINPLLEECDIVLVLFYSKVGAFTLEEYHLAMKKKKKVFLYFKTGFSTEDIIEIDNYKKVLELRNKIGKENRLLFEKYEDIKDFHYKIYKDLNLYLKQTHPPSAPIEKEPLKPSVRSILYRGSKKRYDELRGPTGRFRYLNISEILLPGTGDQWIKTMVSLDTVSDNIALPKALLVLWKQEVTHAVVVGNGGMGKTVSLIHWWKKLLETGEHQNEEPVPVFIALNEFNQVPEVKREDFIKSSILKNYGGHDQESLTDDDVMKTMETPLTVGSKIIPSIVLLLDGFNEITVEKTELLIELKDLVERCKGIQVVITSRYDMRGNFNWEYWNLVRLRELEEEKVAEYLQGKGLAVPGPGRLRGLLGNPMMLTLFAASCEVQAYQMNSRYCCFKETVKAPGELLWNFIEAQVAKLPDRVGPDEVQVVYYWFLLKYLLPGLGYEMEKQGLFDFTNAQFQEGLDRLCHRYARQDFLTAVPQIGRYVNILPVGECGDDLDRVERAARVIDIFCNELHVLVKEGQALRFLHQDFRDFFAAVHLLNEAEISLKKGEIPWVFKERILDYFVRRLVGEIQGEHRCKPYLVKEEGWKIDINKENLLHKVLDLCRGKFGKELGYAVWNLVTIWKEVRGELSGADLSGLDLSGISLNGVMCSRFYQDRYLATVFDGSRVHEKNLLPRGHAKWVTSAVYSPDGKKILSASGDQTIKEWDAGIDQCVKTLDGHTDFVNSAVYSLDGKKILSASSDQTIKEWNAATGQCVKTLAGHTDWVRSAVYSPDGKKILSASGDQTIKEWDAATGQCLKTLAGHTDFVLSAEYSPDGKKILSASGDQTIKEWDAGTGQCVKTLAGHTDLVISANYSPDGKKILSASGDQTIKEWDAGTGQCVKTLAGHTDWVRSAVYSPDGKKILSASSDQTIKEWDAATGQCVKTLAGHTDWVRSAEYSPDGKKILSASPDQTIKEWDAATGECVKTLTGHTAWVNSAEYSPDGKKILSVSGDQTIKEWDAATGQCVKTLAGHTNLVISAVYSPDGKKILSASYDQTIKEWDAGTGQCVKTLSGHTNLVNSAEYSPDGKKILSVSGDQTIKEWDAATGQCVKTLAGHTNLVISAVYSPDGKKILSASYDQTIKEWDAGTGQCVKTLAGHADTVLSAEYSPDGKKILSASSDQTIKEWDAGTGQCEKTLAGHTDLVISAEYSPDGKKILSASYDETIKEWDAATGKCLKTHQRKDNPQIPGYPPIEKNIKLETEGNKIYVPDASAKSKSRELINIPGLFIQGCSFQNLEKGSEWSEEGLKILRQYHARVSVDR